MTDWQARVDAVWEDASLDDAARVAAIAALAAERAGSVTGYAAELRHAARGMPTANTGEGPEPRR